MINAERNVAQSSRPIAKPGSLAPVKQGFRFGRFTLDVRARELQKDGARIRVQDQPFDVLVMLLEQPGEVLTREELRRQLWPDGTFVDFEHGLNAAVKRLRAAIGDRADSPRFIETLHRRGYRFIAPVERIDPPAEPAVSSSGWFGEKPGLAVLPFKDLGESDNHPYFSEGLTEEMITQLGRLCANRLAVAARTSSMLVRRNAHTIRSIGQILRVDYVLAGSVRRHANRVRITAQLIETRGESQVWADTYERDLSDCFLVQADVAARIAHALSLELLPEPRRALGKGTHDLAAYQAYLKGRYHWNGSADGGLLQAISYFEQALALDPEYSCAHSALGRAHVATANSYVTEPRPAFETARAAATRALRLDRTDSDAHLTLAEVLRSSDWNWTEAEDAYRLAISFNPSNEGAYRLYGLFLAARKRPVEAAAALERAYELDPLCLVVNTSTALVRFLEGDCAETIRRCRHTLDMDAKFGHARRLHAAALFQIGQTDEAIAELEEVALERPEAVTLAWLAYMVGIRGDKVRATALLQELRQVAESHYVSAYHLALAHVGIGHMDDALSLLKTAADERDPSFVNLAVEPRFEPLRADPRYRKLVDQLGLM
jgi:TolB-like protein/Tfp pilus assembly protein PilF